MPGSVCPGIMDDLHFKKDEAIGDRETVFVFVCSNFVLQPYFRLVTVMSQRIGNVRV